MPDRPARSVFPHLLVGVAASSVALVALLIGREAVSVFVALVLIVAYVELQRILSTATGVLSVAIGAAGVGGFLWVAYEGHLERLPWVGAALVLALLAAGVLVHEAAGRRHQATESVGATLAAAGVVGVMGAHVLLIRAVPGFGFRGMLAFGLMVFTNDAFALLGGQVLGKRRLAPRLSPAKTWEGATSGFVASVIVGVVMGLALNPPFDVRSGVLLGAAVGVLSPVGDLAFSALKRGAGMKESGRIFGPLGGALDAIDGLLMAAPAFYWAFRTIAI